MNKKLDKMCDILGCDQEVKNPIKVEKKEKCFFTKTEESTILLTEDNKMVLND